MTLAASLVNSVIFEAETLNQTLVGSIAPIYQEDYVDDPLYDFVGDSIEFLTLLPLLFVYLRQTSIMLAEKEKKIRETMLIMGMKLWIYYLTWFLRYFVIYLLIALIGSGVLVAALPSIPYYIPLVLMILMGILLIVQSFFIQIFFTRAKLGILFAFLFFVVQYVIYYIVADT